MNERLFAAVLPSVFQGLARWGLRHLKQKFPELIFHARKLLQLGDVKFFKCLDPHIAPLLVGAALVLDCVVRRSRQASGAKRHFRGSDQRQNRRFLQGSPHEDDVHVRA